MPCLLENIFLSCAKELALKTVATIDFMKWIDPNFGPNTQIVLQNERMIRSISNVPGIGNVEIERIPSLRLTQLLPKDDLHLVPSFTSCLSKGSSITVKEHC